VSSLLAKVELEIKNPLQRYPIESLKVVGIWTLSNKNMKAMIATPDGEGTVVTQGYLIGNRGGKIQSLDENSLTIREFSLSSDGSRQYEDSVLWMENMQPLEEMENKIVIRSDRAGVPNDYGYGNKNYYNSNTYEKKHEDVLKRLEEQKSDEIDSDENRPVFKDEKDKKEDQTSKSIKAEKVNKDKAPVQGE
jgi:hypothetical protein